MRAYIGISMSHQPPFGGSVSNLKRFENSANSNMNSKEFDGTKGVFVNLVVNSGM